MNIMAQKVEFLRRYCNSLRGWVNDNPIVKRGNIVCVSTKDDGEYDIVFMSDGKHTFLQLLDNFKNGISVEGQGLTEAERQHLKEALTKDDLGEIENTIKDLVALVDEDTDGVINKFNEIVAFLGGISDTSTLDGIVSGISTQISSLGNRIDEVEKKIPSTYAFDKMEKLVVDGKTYSVKDILTALVPLMDETVVVVTGKE